MLWRSKKRGSKKKKTKFQKLRSIFANVAAAALGITFTVNSLTSYFNDQTGDILKRADMTQEQLDSVTDANFNVMYADTDAAKIYAYSRLSPELISIVDDYHKYKGDPDYFNAFATKMPILGDGELADDLTLGLSGLLFPAAVMFPTEDIEFDEMFSLFSGFNRAYAANLNSDYDDFLRMILLHEIAHAENRMLMDRAEAELVADQGAIAKYRQLGGQEDGPKEWIYCRATTSTQLFLLVRGDSEFLEDFGYIMAPVLHAEENGQTPMSIEESRQAHYDMADYLYDYAEKKGFYVPIDNISLAYFMQMALSDEEHRLASPLDDNARAVMELYIEATEHFTNLVIYAPRNTVSTFSEEPSAQIAEEHPALREKNMRRLTH